MRRFSLLVAPLAVLLLLSGLVLRSASVSAGTALRMDVADLARHSGLVVEGSVLSARALDRGGRIETEYLLRVDRTLVGEDRPFRAVRLPGGILASGRGLILAGMPRIAAGERVFLFLTEEGESGIRMPVGLSQGKFTVVQRADGRKALLRDAAGVTLVGPNGNVLEGEGRAVLDYAQVIAEIEAGRQR